MNYKKLLVLSSTYPRWRGDPEPGFVHELAKRMTAQLEVRVLCPHAQGALTQETLEGVEIVRYRYAPSRFETLVNNGGIINNLKCQPWKWLLVPFFLLRLLWCTWREVRGWHPDIIHAHWLLPQGLTVALLGLLDHRTPPLFVTSHGADLFALRAYPLTALKRFVARHAAALTVVSQAMKDELARIGVSIHKVTVQSMGVNLTSRFITAPDQLRSRDEILFVGRLVEKKGLRFLLAALPEILSNHPSAFLTVVGYGPEENERRAQAESLGITHKVNFLGALTQAELPTLYQRAAVFVAPFIQADSGDQEGLGLVLVEALGCGCPVVASHLPATLDVVRDKVTGLLTQPGDTADLVVKINRLLNEPKLGVQLGQAGRKLVASHYDWNQVTERYLAILNQVAVQVREQIP